MNIVMEVLRRLDAQEAWLTQLYGSRYFELVHTIYFLIDEEPLLKECITELRLRYKIDSKIIDAYVSPSSNSALRVGRTMEMQAAIAFELLSSILQRGEKESSKSQLLGNEKVIHVGEYFKEISKHFSGSASSFSDAEFHIEKARVFHSAYIQPILVYLREALARRGFSTHLLRRYRARAEWFDRADLLQKYKNNMKQGEQVLATSLYSFLFDQGMPFVLESKVPSGEVDLLTMQPEGQRLLAEAKVFDPDNNRNKGYVAGGYSQIRRYMNDFNESTGYLIIFNASDTDIIFNDFTDGETLPLIMHENTRVFLLLINLIPTTSASSPKKRHVVNFKADDFINAKTAKNSQTNKVN